MTDSEFELIMKRIEKTLYELRTTKSRPEYLIKEGCRVRGALPEEVEEIEKNANNTRY